MKRKHRTYKRRGIRRQVRALFRNLLYADSKSITAGGLALLLVAVLAVASLGAAYKNLMATRIDPVKYTPLLNIIAKGESNGNYNAYFGHSDNTAVRFTDMSVAQVLQWQDEYVKQGHASSAVGKYQIINTTLRGLVQQLDIDPSAKFDEAMQDKMAIALLERRGAVDYVDKKLSRDEFAANLAREWAALPKITGPNPEQSYYAGDGINKVRISIDEIFTALASLQS